MLNDFTVKDSFAFGEEIVHQNSKAWFPHMILTYPHNNKLTLLMRLTLRIISKD